MDINLIQKVGIIVSVFFSILFVTVIIAVLFAIYWFSFNAMRRLSDPTKNRVLRATGEAAQATILNVKRTSVTINDDPIIDIFLQIRRTAHPTYQAQTTTLISLFKISQLQVGAIIPVRIDPYNPQNVALDIDIE